MQDTESPAVAGRAKTAEYVVLRRNSGVGATTETWERVGRSYSGTAEQAIKEASRNDDDQGHIPGTYVAVPLRSWKPVTLTTETRVTVKLS